MNEVGATRTVELPVEGMHCEGCVARVRAALLAAAGVEHLDVSQGRVLLDYYPEVATIEELRARIEALGYVVPGPSPRGGVLRRFLEKMAAENEKAFGNERLDCCTMRKKNR